MPAFAKLCLFVLLVAAMVPLESGIRALRHYARQRQQAEITLTSAKIGLRAAALRTERR